MSRPGITYLICLLLLVAVGISDAAAQIESEGTGINPASIDTTRTDSLLNDSTQAGPVKPSIEIIPWQYNHAIGSTLAGNDSLMRWQNIPDWTFKKNRDPGVFSYRLGTVGRSSSLMIDAHEPRQQKLLWEDIPMHNRVSGTVNWSVIPIHKINTIYEQNGGISHTTNFTLKPYYANKPLTKLIFDESKFDRRALEFWITQNFSQKTNVELSFWDRRGGGGFPNSSFTGTQIFGRVYHQYDNRQFFKLRFLKGNRNLGEPFGYAIPDLANYAFDRFRTSPNESSAKSENGFSTLALSYHRRPADTTLTRERLRAGIYLNNQKREVTYSADTTFHKTGVIGGYFHKWIELKPFSIEGFLRYEQASNKERDRSSLALDNWSKLTARGAAALQPVPWAKLEGSASYRKRNDFNSHSLGADLGFNFADRIKLSGGVSRGTMMPTLQQLYWNSDEYSGSEGLRSEQIMEAHASAEFRILPGLDLGGRGQFKEIEDGVLLNDQNQFVNIREYQSASATGYLDFESTHFELSASGNVHQYMNAIPQPATGVPEFNTTRIWLKGGAYWKGYMFDRATYVKAGVSGMFSPFQYRAEHYETALDYWQPASMDSELPWFSRLDVNISARIRAVMFVLRFENVLDDVSQLGYFETANYPMPPRRFLFGVRAMFNN